MVLFPNVQINVTANQKYPLNGGLIFKLINLFEYDSIK